MHDIIALVVILDLVNRFRMKADFNKFPFRFDMPESKFYRRRNLQNPELDHLQQTRKMTELYSMGYDNESV